jgi:hypothetical protein
LEWDTKKYIFKFDDQFNTKILLTEAKVLSLNGK